MATNWSGHVSIGFNEKREENHLSNDFGLRAYFVEPRLKPYDDVVLKRGVEDGVGGEAGKRANACLKGVGKHLYQMILKG